MDHTTRNETIRALAAASAAAIRMNPRRARRVRAHALDRDHVRDRRFVNVNDRRLRMSAWSRDMPSNTDCAAFEIAHCRARQRAESGFAACIAVYGTADVRDNRVALVMAEPLAEVRRTELQLRLAVGWHADEIRGAA